MAGRYYVTAAGGFRFLLQSADGTTLMTGQLLPSLKGCCDAVERFRGCVVAPVEDQTLEDFVPVHPPKYELFKDSANRFRFRLTDGDGVLAVSEPCGSKPLCSRLIDAVAAAADGAATEFDDRCIE